MGVVRLDLEQRADTDLEIQALVAKLPSSASSRSEILTVNQGWLPVHRSGNRRRSSIGADNGALAAIEGCFTLRGWRPFHAALTTEGKPLQIHEPTRGYKQIEEISKSVSCFSTRTMTSSSALDGFGGAGPSAPLWMEENSPWCLQALSLLEMEGVPEGVPSPLSKFIHMDKLPQLAFELDEESKKHFNFDEEDFLCSRKGNFECLAKHLKRVEIIGFAADSFGSKTLLALIKFILGDALVLEKLIIKAELPARHVQKHLQAAVLSKLLGVSKNVLSCPRASKKAEVIFNYPFK
ncbi:hypothetical protein NL676_007088 [Syzygium grande]|nr:hypothetical protein NL676_007088 [Syzygium grande]